jgi:hypothetical protein
LIVILSQGNRVHRETVDVAKGTQQRDITTSVLTETEVFTNGNGLHVEALDQQIVHEVLRGLLRSRLIEGNHARPIDTGSLEQGQLSVETREHLRRHVGSKNGQRVAIERHDDDLEVSPGLASKLVDDVLVPQVHPVVDANGGNRASGVGLSCLRDVDAHGF